jgi:glycosyltransferase involved in cell wall biosynthesis
MNTPIPRKKIFVVANTSWYLFNFRLNLMLQLQGLGYEVVAVAPPDEYSARFATYSMGFKAMPMDNQGTNPVKDSLLIARFIALFLGQRPAVVLSFTPKCNIYAGLAARWLNTPIVNNVSGLGTAFIRENLITKIVERLYIAALKKSRKVFFQNSDDLTLFVQKKLVNNTLTELLPGSGVDVKRFSPLPQTEKPDRFVFLCVARMLRDKGIVELVESMRLLKPDYPHIECQLLGFLDAKNATAVSKAEMQAWVDEGLVHYLGVSDQVVDFLRQADCVVLPSYREGTPRSLLEAASVAKPIITTDAVGCREVVDDGANGFLCEIKNVASLKAKMEQMLLLSESERLQMGQRGREKMLRQFDEKIVIDRYIQLIQSIA